MKRFAPATQRNRESILAVLRRALPASGSVLEIAAGTGEHAVTFAAALPGLTWQPSDPDPMARDSIAAWVEEASLPNLRPPIELDVCATPWPVTAADAVVCINMIHISPWHATEGLCAGAGAIVPSGGTLYLYGPYLVAGLETAPSNRAFDQQLRAQDPAWGLRDLHAVVQTADAAGFTQTDLQPMPANNFSVVFRKR